MRYAMIGLVMAVLVGTTACSNMSPREQRALSGGAIGAGGGAAIGAITGGSPLTGALIGGAGGAAIGALLPGGDHRR
jgi:osmotically inducible lipoprotein OsmB